MGHSDYMLLKIKTYLNIVTLLTGVILLPIASLGQTKTTNSDRQGTIVQNKYGLDPATPLTARIIKTPAVILQKFRDAGMSPTIHNLTKADSMKVVNAFLKLPALHQDILANHLLGISFLDNMPNTALTATVNPDDSFPVFTITFRAEILKQNVSQWLTEKELSYFTRDQPNLHIAIEAGKLDAILYVLLHEATHVVDGALGILAGNVDKTTPSTSTDIKNFPKNIWLNRTDLPNSFGDTLTKHSRFRNGGKLIPMECAQQIYQSAAQKPFVSLYSTSSWHEDLAEYLTVTHFTKKLKQPFKIIIYNDQKEIFTYEPMQSAAITSRIPLMNYFYKKRN